MNAGVPGSVLRALGVFGLALVVSAHVGSPDVFFAGRAGPYDVRVIVRPPAVVPGVARVTVHAPRDAQSVSIRPVFWRAGSRGAPPADDMRRLEGQSQTFEGSLWLMARGAYTVDVIVDGARGKASVLVPVASVATGRLALDPMLGGLLLTLGIVLVAGLVNIVYKGAGESLVDARDELDAVRRKRARKVAAIAVPVLALALFGGAQWWNGVDRDYQRSIYEPAPLEITPRDGMVILRVTDILQRSNTRRVPLLRDHGKLMHLFLVKADDARAFAHLHPALSGDSTVPTLTASLPALPPGAYRAYGDVVDETGFERTVVGSLAIPDTGARPTASARPPSDPDDAWYVGEATRDKTMKLADGSLMSIEFIPNAMVQAGREATIRVSVLDPAGKPARLEPYLGMTAHGVVTRVDGAVYVHLHPMGTITMAAQEAFLARDRGDTTQAGRLRLADHATQALVADSLTAIEFPYAFPRGGNYRLFIQVKRNGRILTGAFAVPVAEAADAKP